MKYFHYFLYFAPSRTLTFVSSAKTREWNPEAHKTRVKGAHSHITRSRVSMPSEGDRLPPALLLHTLGCCQPIQPAAMWQMLARRPPARCPDGMKVSTPSPSLPKQSRGDLRQGSRGQYPWPALGFVKYLPTQQFAPHKISRGMRYEDAECVNGQFGDQSKVEVCVQKPWLSHRMDFAMACTTICTNPH